MKLEKKDYWKLWICMAPSLIAVLIELFLHDAVDTIILFVIYDIIVTSFIILLIYLVQRKKSSQEKNKH